MYYINKETFDTLPDETKQQVLKDTKEHFKFEEGMEDETEEPKMSPAEEKEAMAHEEMMGEEEEKNKIKDFDEAGDKGLALMIGVGKVKPKKDMKAKAKPANNDEE